MPAKKKKLYVGLMSLGAAALFVDRCVLIRSTTVPVSASASASASASESEAPDAADGNGPRRVAKKTPARPSRAAANAAPESRLPIPELPFPRGVRPLDPATSIRDVFSPPWAGAVGQPEESATDKPQDAAKSGPRVDRTTAAQFASQHRLHASMIQERLRIAIVDGTWLQVGSVVDGCTLMEITGESVRFQCHDGPAELRLPGPAASPAD